MNLRQISWLALLTLLYLCFELAFNARLLDVVGGGADENQIHAIEHFGRSLSGIALALFVLQGLLGLKNLGAQGKPGGRITLALIGVIAITLPFAAASTFWPLSVSALIAAAGSALVLWFANRLRTRDCNGASSYCGILLVCGGVAVSVFFSLQKLTDSLVDASTPSFRHASHNIVLVQKALVDGKARMDGLSDDARIFAKPEGKAFLALFPLMAVSVERLDEKIRSAKYDLIRDEVGERVGGPAGLYKKYADGVKSVAEQWKQYNAAGNGGAVDIESQQRQAWDDYLHSLSRHGWTPYTVPDRYRGRVLRNVQAKVPVSNSWDLADQAAFNAAVAQKIERRVGGRGNGIAYKGKQIPFGLSWPAFFAHSAVQGELRRQLGLPPQVVLQVGYRSGDQFEREVFNPLVENQSRQQLKIYDAPVETFADGEKYAEEGRRMARAAIVPPLALFFSLLGALGHLCKLIYLSSKGALQAAFPKRVGLQQYVIALPIAVFLGLGLALHSMENDVTRSRLYSYLQQQVRGDASAVSNLLVGVLHIVAVGQGVFYPFDEKLRTDVLGGMSFGYHPKQASI